jgi:hypothetical protein
MRLPNKYQTIFILFVDSIPRFWIRGLVGQEKSSGVWVAA